MTVHWRQNDLGDEAFGGWWRELSGAGVLPSTGRIVVHVPERQRTPRVIRTLASLVTYLRRNDACRIGVLGRGLTPDVCAGAELLPLSSSDTVVVDSPCLSPGTPIGDLWFEPVSLVTVTGVGPDPRYRISGVLPAHAELLAGARGLDLDLAF